MSKIAPYVCPKCNLGVKFRDYINVGSRQAPAWLCRKCVDVEKQAEETARMTTLSLSHSNANQETGR